MAGGVTVATAEVGVMLLTTTVGGLQWGVKRGAVRQCDLVGLQKAKTARACARHEARHLRHAQNSTSAPSAHG